MGSLRPDGAGPILKVLLVFSRVAIESLLSNMSLLSLQIADAKLQNKWNNRIIRDNNLQKLAN
jgi:hypothetical protein